MQRITSRPDTPQVEHQTRAQRLADDLTGAATRCELEIHLQPEVDLSNGRLAAAEALLRWYHPTEGVFWPADVLPLAQARGGSNQLTSWVLGTAAAAALRWPEPDGVAERTCWVNISGDAADTSAQTAVGLVRRLGLPAGRLGLHVPAQALAFDPATASRWIAECRAAGIPVLADGLGHHRDPEHVARATQAQARALVGVPLSGIVLSRDVVRRCVEHEDVAAAVVHVTTLARQSGWDVGATGVESWEEATLLDESGVARATGHLFGAAVRADRLRWMLDRAGSTWRGTYVGDRKGSLHVEHDVLVQARQVRDTPEVTVTGRAGVPAQRQAVEDVLPVLSVR
jgi:EAL domain-containing protein (putative c-di-GMP-specific phosphodiesterase class I)